MLDTRITRRTALKTAGAGLALPALAAPAFGRRAAAQEATTVRFASWLGAAEGLVQLWNDSHDEITVTFEEIPFDNYADKLLIDMASGTAPDAFHWPSPWWLPMMRRGVFQPINELITRDGIDLAKFVFPPTRLAEFEGSLYGLPYALPTTRILIYNKRLFREAGVEEPTEEWTWDDLAAAAETLHDPPNVYAMPFPPHQLNLESMILSNGGGIVSEDGTQCLLDAPEAVEAIEVAIGWYRDLGVTMEPGQEDALGDEPFASDKLAMAFISIPGWQSWQRYTREGQIEAGVVMFPVSPETKVRRTSAEAHMIAIANTSENVDAAWEFIKWSQTSDEAMTYWIDFYPVNYDLDRYLQAVPEGPQREVTSLRRKYMDTMEVQYWGPNTTEAQRFFRAEFDLAMLGEKPVAEAMAAACEEIDGLLAGG